MEAWIRILEDETRYARQHEILRAKASHLIVIISGAVLGVVTLDTNSDWARPEIACGLSIFVVAINLLGFLTSRKHYERARRHQAIAGAIRSVLSDTYPLGAWTLTAVRQEAEDGHKRRFPVFAKMPRVHDLWVGLHLALGAVGLVGAATALTAMSSGKDDGRAAETTKTGVVLLDPRATRCCGSLCRGSARAHKETAALAGAIDAADGDPVTLWRIPK